MSAFGDDFDTGDADPAAEFLAREQNELAGLEDELKPAGVTYPNPVVNGSEPELSDSTGGFEIINPVGQQDGNNDFILNEVEMPPQSISPSPKIGREEPEKIKKWREDQKKLLETKDLDEEKKKEEWKQAAKKELDDWYKHHEELVAKTRAANRNAEKQFVAEEGAMEPGTEWERISKLCDFNPKASRTSKDVSRMRSIILQLKQSPHPIKQA